MARVRAAAERRPALDHLLRAGGRYKSDGGDRLAASLTYYGFLALFPLLLLALSVLGFVLANRPEVQGEVFAKITDALPGIGDIVGDSLFQVEEHKTSTGVVGLVGLLFSGFGGVAALRESLRIMWHQNTSVGNIAKKKLVDLVALLGLSATMLVSLGISAVGAVLSSWLLDRVGVAGTAADVSLRVVSVALVLLTDTALFVYLFRRLPRVDWPFRRVLQGAVFGAVGFGVIKLAGSFYVARTAERSEALFGTLGLVIGVLVGINLVSRWILFTAAWTVTAPGCDDVPPSGSSSPEAAIKAGLTPEEARRLGLQPVDAAHPAADPYPDTGRIGADRS